MTELRTMKDIEPGIAFSGKEVKELGLKFSDMKKVEFIQSERDKNIKLEAIKWIKRLSSPNYHFGELGIPYSHAARDPLVVWIKHFFNITEEEPK